MTAWTNDELTKIGSAEELEIAPLRKDGTLRKPVIIWVVRLGDELYVRAVNGRNAVWFRSAQVQHEGRIQAGDVMVLAGDCNVGDPLLDGYSGPGEGIDHLLVKGARPLSVDTWPQERRVQNGVVLSDHPVVEARLRIGEA